MKSLDMRQISTRAISRALAYLGIEEREATGCLWHSRETGCLWHSWDTGCLWHSWCEPARATTREVCERCKTCFTYGWPSAKVCLGGATPILRSDTHPGRGVRPLRSMRGTAPTWRTRARGEEDTFFRPDGLRRRRGLYIHIPRTAGGALRHAVRHLPLPRPLPLSLPVRSHPFGYSSERASEGTSPGARARAHPMQ